MFDTSTLIVDEVGCNRFFVYSYIISKYHWLPAISNDATAIYNQILFAPGDAVIIFLCDHTPPHIDIPLVSTCSINRI